MLVTLFTDLTTQKQFEPLRLNKPVTPEEQKSCLKNVGGLPVEEYALALSIELLTALHRTLCPPTLSKSVLNAYTILEVRSAEGAAVEKAGPRR